MAVVRTSGGTQGLDVIEKTGLGFVSWNFFPQNISTQSAFATQVIYAIAVPVKAGQVIANVVVDVEVAASGTAPTNIFFGIADIANLGSIGTLRAKTADVAAGSFTQAIQSYALSAAYTVPVNGNIAVLALVNGTWSVTQAAFGRGSGRVAAGGASGPFFSATCGTAQTALPSVGSALPAAFSVTGALQFWAGVS
jgi:hypothetical protein